MRRYHVLGFFLIAGLAGPGCLRESVIASVQAVCGDGRCDEGETPVNCAVDCFLGLCGNHLCEFDESEETCPGDCPALDCGDLVCEGSETPGSCPEDCQWGLCGNNVCEAKEVESGCNLDCLPSHCGNEICDAVETVADCPQDCPPTRAVDILLVVDDSNSMALYQARLSEAMPAMYEGLIRRLGDELDIHVGVVTTDLGADGYQQIAGCDRPGGDKGILGLVGGLDRSGDCLGPGSHFLRDVSPRECNIVRFADGQCGQSDCTDDHCHFEAGTHLVLDAATNCPRCRNFEGTAETVFSCLVSVGVDGCGFEQPLEAMRVALQDRVANAGFLRDDSLLVVLFLSDEDDCSAEDPTDLFNPDPELESRLGRLSSYRCTRFGVACAETMDESGSKSDCRPAPANGLVADAGGYADFLMSLRGPGRVILATITGPFDGSLFVEEESSHGGGLQLGSSCFLDPDGQGALPAVRLTWVGRLFQLPGSESLEQSICGETYGALAETLAREISTRLEIE